MPLYSLTGNALNQASPREVDPYARLGAAVLESAYKDLAKGKPGAETFFSGGFFTLWADAAGVDHELVMDGYRSVLANGLPVVDERQVRYSGRAR